MTIALVAHDSKKELMVQFCTAYRHILAQHHLIATGTTGRLVEENVGLLENCLNSISMNKFMVHTDLLPV